MKDMRTSHEHRILAIAMRVTACHSECTRLVPQPDSALPTAATMSDTFDKPPPVPVRIIASMLPSQIVSQSIAPWYFDPSQYSRRIGDTASPYLGAAFPGLVAHSPTQ